ncbi:RIMS-binding protein 2 isoform X1 [Tachysurus ichikawai]
MENQQAARLLKHEVLPLHLSSGNRFHLLEETNRTLKLEVATLRQQKQLYKSLLMTFVHLHFQEYKKPKSAFAFCK